MKKKTASAAPKKLQKKTQKTEPSSPVVEPEPMGAESIDKVREIIFGAQLKEYEKKFHKLEELIQKEIKNMRSETKKNLDFLEEFIQKETSSLKQSLKTEISNREESENDLDQKVNETRKNIEKKLGQFNQTFSNENQEIREQILHHSKQLMEEIQLKYAELGQTVEKAVAELNDTKTDRTTLANLLSEVAMRLKEEFYLHEK